jgi:hypothetical protein
MSGETAVTVLDFIVSAVTDKCCPEDVFRRYEGAYFIFRVEE